MMINLESFKLLDFSSVHIFYAAAAYLIMLFFTGRLNALKIVLFLLSLASMFIQPAGIFLVILSSINLIQAVIFLRKKHHTTAYKYFLYSFLFIFINIPALNSYYKILLFCVFLLKSILASYTDEINDPFTLILNTALVSIMVINTQATAPDSMLLANILFIGLLMGLTRNILDKSLKTPIFVLPFFILASATSSPLVTVFLMLYTFFTIATYYRYKRDFNFSFACLLTIPFVDCSIFQTASQTNSPVFSFSLILLTFVLVGKLWETHFKEIISSYSNKSVIDIVVGLGLAIAIKVADYKVVSPIPLMVAIPAIVIEARYLRIFSKIPFNETYLFLSRILNKTYKFKYKSTRKVRILSKLFAKIFIRKASLLSKESLILIKVVTIKYWVNTNRKTRQMFSGLLNNLTLKIFNHLGFEELLAVISVIVLILIYFLGDK